MIRCAVGRLGRFVLARLRRFPSLVGCLLTAGVVVPGCGGSAPPPPTAESATPVRPEPQGVFTGVTTGYDSRTSTTTP